MRQPIHVSGPERAILDKLRDRQRASSLVYEHLVTTAGLGVAEQWLELLDITRADDPLSLAVRASDPCDGWVMSTNRMAEAIARGNHPAATTAVRALSLRVWDEAKLHDRINRPGAYR